MKTSTPPESLHWLMLSAISAIVERSVPLSLAVQLTPEMLRAAWADASLEDVRTFLCLRRHPGLLAVTMLAARRAAEQIAGAGHSMLALQCMAHIEAVVAGREESDVLRACRLPLQRRAREFAIETGPRERLELLQHAMDAAMYWANQRDAGSGSIAKSANSALLRADDYLTNSARAEIETALRALGPPTLEDIVRAAEEGP